MTKQTTKWLAKSLIDLGTAACIRQSSELRSKAFDKVQHDVVRSLAKFLEIGTQMDYSSSGHKFDKLVAAMTTTHTQETHHSFEVIHRHSKENLVFDFVRYVRDSEKRIANNPPLQPDYSLPALRRVARQLGVNNGETMDAKVSVLSLDPDCYSLDHEISIMVSQISNDSRLIMQDLMRLIHPSEVDRYPDEVEMDSSLQPVATDLWTLLIDDKAKCTCLQALSNHLQEPLLGLCPHQDESGNIAFDMLFHASCTSMVAESTLNCTHESLITFKR